MNRLEYALAAALLRLVGWLARLRPVQPDLVVLATARVDELEGNLLWLERAIRRLRPDLRIVLLLEPYGYGLRAKLAYALRLVRGMVLLQRARLFVVDNAYLPIHVAAHPSATTVVQVWHATGALKRFGVDTRQPLAEPEATFLHRNYDAVVCSGDASRAPWSAALRTPLERVLPLGTPRTDFFYDAEAMAAARTRLSETFPAVAGRRVILHAPTFRGRGRGKRPAAGLDAARLRAALPAGDVIVLKSHPNLDPSGLAVDGYDVVADPTSEINDWLALADVLVTDYSSSIFEWALLRRPLVLLVDDLSEYERDPGLYLDYRTELIGRQVVDTDGVIAAIAGLGRGDDGGLGEAERAAYEAFIAGHLAPCDGTASERFVTHFLGGPERAGSSDGRGR